MMNLEDAVGDQTAESTRNCGGTIEYGNPEGKLISAVEGREVINDS